MLAYTIVKIVVISTVSIKDEILTVRFSVWEDEWFSKS